MNIIGQKFNRLTVLELFKKEQVYLFNGKKNGFRYFYTCLCDCGKLTVVAKSHLLSGHTQSCGCISQKHLKTDTRLFRIWNGIKGRCFNKNNNKFKNYGGRGISIYEEWKNDFKAFYDWSMANGYQEDLTIDRIDNNGNYEPNNCRWVSQKVQQNNKSNSCLIEYNGKSLTLSQWAELYGLNYSTVKSRLSYGWTIEKALLTPVKTIDNQG